MLKVIYFCSFIWVIYFGTCIICNHLYVNRSFYNALHFLTFSNLCVFYSHIILLSLLDLHLMFHLHLLVLLMISIVKESNKPSFDISFGFGYSEFLVSNIMLTFLWVKSLIAYIWAIGSIFPTIYYSSSTARFDVFIYYPKITCNFLLEREKRIIKPLRAIYNTYSCWCDPSIKEYERALGVDVGGRCGEFLMMIIVLSGQVVHTISA